MLGRYLVGLALGVILLGGLACSGEEQGAQPRRYDSAGGDKDAGYRAPKV